MNIEIARSFFLWCSVINYVILLVWTDRHARAKLAVQPGEPVIPSLDGAV